MKKSYIELYKFMKEKNEQGKTITGKDIYLLYEQIVYLEKFKKNEGRMRELEKGQIYNNAQAWFDRAIIALIQNGYIGLFFKS